MLEKEYIKEVWLIEAWQFSSLLNRNHRFIYDF